MGKSCLVVAEMWNAGVGQSANPLMGAKANEHACALGRVTVRIKIRIRVTVDVCVRVRVRVALLRGICF